MWRRNNKHVEDAKIKCNEIYIIIKDFLGSQHDNMLKPVYKNIDIEKYINKSINDISKSIYDKTIQNTDDNDQTVLKTIKSYYPTIINNQTDINFILHNTYGTINYKVKNSYMPTHNDKPSFFIEPITNKLCLLLIFNENEINIDKAYFKIPIQSCNKTKDIKTIFINQYITSNATSLVVDDTNIEYINFF